MEITISRVELIIPKFSIEKKINFKDFKNIITIKVNGTQKCKNDKKTKEIKTVENDSLKFIEIQFISTMNNKPYSLKMEVFFLYFYHNLKFSNFKNN